MKLATWSPEYECKDVYLKSDSEAIKLKLDETEQEVQKANIGVAVLGAVQTFMPMFDKISDSIESTVSLLDGFEDLGIENLFYVHYAHRENGEAMIGDLAEFEAKEYKTKCRNPLVDTSMLEDLAAMEVLFVAGFESDKEVLQFVQTVNAYRASGKLENLKHVVVVDSCTTTIDRKDEDLWAKYKMQQDGAVVAHVYRGETKIA